MKKLFISIMLLMIFASTAMSAALQIDALWSGINNPSTGKSYGGAIIATFESGTSTPKAVWEDKEQTLPSTLGKAQFNLDSNGQAFVFGDGLYKINIYAPTDTGLTNPLITIDGATYLVSGGSGVSFNDVYNCDLPTALAALGSVDPVQLNVDCDCIIASGTTETITDNIATNIINDGSFDGVAGGGIETLNINGPLIIGEHAAFGDNLVIAGTADTPYVSLTWYSPYKDGTTNDAIKIKRALDFASTSKVRLKIREGTYFVANPGISITINDAFIEGTSQSFLKCERTYFDDSGSGTAKYTIGQGNIFNADTVTNITLKNITIIGAYNSGWGEQSVYANNVPAGEGSRLLFLLDCNNVTLDNFHIKESFSSYVTLTGTFEADTQIANGYNQIFLTSCIGVKLLKCSWTESIGEAWSMWDCTNVLVDGCTFDNDYGVSMLDITYSTYIRVTNNKFLKRLQSDSGDLLNVASAHVAISNNHLLNGGIDVGNEFLNVNSTRGASFLIENTVVSNNTVYNGGISMSMGNGTYSSSLTWAQENVIISNNTITEDIDNRPAANGSTVLNYAAISLPTRENTRDVSILDNIISLKGELQSGGASKNLMRLINMSIDDTGYKRKNIAIKNNKITCDITNYDPDLLNNISGAIVGELGEWTNLSIKDNEINCPTGIMFRRHESMERITIHANEVYGENFLNMPWSDTTFDITDFDINSNKFIFKDTIGHTYTGTDLETKGYGYFISMNIGRITDLVRFNIDDNKVVAPGFAFITNFQTSASIECDVNVEQNNVLFTDYGALSGTVYPIRMGRTNTDNDYSSVRLINNYFTEEASATDRDITIQEWSKLDILRNEFIGDFDLTLDCDNLSGETDSRYLYKDNIALNGTFTIAQGNAATAVSGFTRPFINADATPSIAGGHNFLTVGTTTITDFDNGVVDQIITIIAETSITITDGTNIFLDGSANFAMTATDTLTLIQKSDGKWYETARGDNGA